MITRPNGKVYNPRKPPIADFTSDDDGLYGGVIVLRTFDVDLARYLARPLWYEVDDSISVDEIAPTCDWLRLVPNGSDCFMWTLDETRGVPCVMFRRKR
jgi:hypothetical protein